MVMLDRLFAVLSPRAALRRADRLAAGGRAGPAFRLYARAARAGLAEAEYRVARGYLEGSGVPPSQDEGVRWLERAATQGFVDAQARLAWMCVQGWARAEAPDAALTARPAASLFSANEPREPDFERAIAWARRAAEAGSPDGQVALAYILTSGPDAMRDLEEAHRWYEKAAASGSPQGALGYALSLARLAKSEDDQRHMVAQLRRAAEHGLPTALYLMGVLTDGGVGTERDPAEAAQFYRQAAEKGSRNGQARWGLALMEGRGRRRTPPRANRGCVARPWPAMPKRRLWSATCMPRAVRCRPTMRRPRCGFAAPRKRGTRPPPGRSACLYLTGAGVARDPEEATRWFRIAAEAGDRNAQADLANLVLRGAGDPEDLVRTGRWFEEAAASGDLVAAFNFGVCLAEGMGVQRDERQAAQWLRRAADGVVTAQYWYARMLLEGRGVTPTPRRPAPGWQRAAKAGMVDAQVAIAEMMVNGRGGPRDQEAALSWFEKAAEKGHVGAMFAMGALKSGGHDRGARPSGGAALVPRRSRAGPCTRADDAGALSGPGAGRREECDGSPRMAQASPGPGTRRGAAGPCRPAVRLAKEGAVLRHRADIAHSPVKMTTVSGLKLEHTQASTPSGEKFVMPHPFGTVRALSWGPRSSPEGEIPPRPAR